MSDGPEWFAAKRYGLGAGPPIAWQGWLVLAAFVALGALTATIGRERPLIAGSIAVPVFAILLIVTARTTRGGWHWRWGKGE